MKGFSAAFLTMLAVIILLVFVGIFWAGMRNIGSPPPSTEPTGTKSVECATNNDCPGNERCLRIYPEYPIDFCGCTTNEDCIGGFCDSDYRCKENV